MLARKLLCSEYERKPYIPATRRRKRIGQECLIIRVDAATTRKFSAGARLEIWHRQPSTKSLSLLVYIQWNSKNHNYPLQNCNSSALASLLCPIGHVTCSTYSKISPNLFPYLALAISAQPMTQSTTIYVWTISDMLFVEIEKHYSHRLGCRKRILCRIGWDKEILEDWCRIRTATNGIRFPRVLS